MLNLQKRSEFFIYRHVTARLSRLLFSGCFMSAAACEPSLLCFVLSGIS